MQNNNIPKEWIWTKLGETVNFYSGTGFPEKFQGKKKGKYSFYKVGDISRNVQANNRILQFTENYIDDDILKIIKGVLLPSNTIVFAKIGEALKLNRRALTKNVCLVDNNVIGIKAKIFNNFYLFNYFLTIRLENISRATTVPSIRKSDLELIKFPLPPLPEQIEIVNRIESLFSKLDEGVDSLKKIKEQIKTYKQSVLKWAFEGRLTNNQVGANNPEVGTYGRSYLPRDWKWVKLGEIALSINPGFPSGKHNIEKKGIPHIRPMNIDYYGKIDLNVIKYVEIEKYKNLTKNDVLFNNTNSPELLGKTTYIDKDTNWAYSNHMTRIKIKDDNFYKYIAYYLHFLFWKGYYKLHCTNHVNQASINKSFLENRVIIPLPPLPEQKTIVSEIERRFSAVDKLEQSIDESLEKAKILRQSILKKAFNGELTELWRKEHQELVTGENSAERLLERIKMEKE